MIRELPAELPIWQDMPDGIHQKLVKSWSWLGVTLPAGFISDGTTVPWWARWLISVRGRHVYAAYLHDYLLKTTTRKRAAMKFLYALKVLGVPRWKRLLMFRAVKLNDWWKENG